MELQRLEKYKQQYSNYSQAINAVQNYLNDITLAPSPNISTGAMASSLAIPVLDLVFILSLAEKEHLMKKVFHVYSEGHDFLGKFESPSQIPDTLINNNTGKKVEKEDFYIDLLFEVEK